MDNVPTKQKYASALMAAVLIFGAVSFAFMGSLQPAQAAVTITQSSTTWFGPGFVRVLITDTSLDNAGDTITPTIEARDGNTLLGSINPTVESIGSSGTFELFITTSQPGLVPINPTKTLSNAPATFNDGPFIVNIYDGAAAGNTKIAPGGGEDVNQNFPAPTHGSNNYGLDLPAGEFLDEGNTVRVLYGGQTVTLNFDDQAAKLASDRNEAGNDNEITLSVTDNDANLDPTGVDEFEFATPTALLTSTNTISYNDAKWVETGQNTGIFELTVVVNGVGLTDNNLDNGGAIVLPTSNSFTIKDHSVYADDPAAPVGENGIFNANAPYIAITSESATSSKSITLINRDGSIVLLDSVTFANGLSAQVSDADRNISMADEDDINLGEIVIWVDFNQDGIQDPGEFDFFDFTETGDGTGVFLPDYSDDKIDVVLGPVGNVDGINGIITLTIGSIQDDIDIVATYTDPAFQSDDEFSLRTEYDTTPGTISLNQVEATVNDRVTLTLNDADLNTDSDTVQTYVIDDAADGVFNINGAPVGNLEITARNTAVNMARPGLFFSATFIETGDDTGIFEATDVDMGDINDDLFAQGAATLDDGDEIEFTYNDEMEDPVEDDDASLNIGRPDATIDTDRSTIPVPTAGDPVTVIITVFDTNANTNPGSVETVKIELNPAGPNNPGITLKNGDDQTFNSEANLADITAHTGIANDITLTETGPNTGIFEEDVDLNPTLGIADIDKLRDTRVTFHYRGTGDDETTSVTYRSYDGVITATPSAVGPNGQFIVKVVDQDINKDPDKIEKLQVAWETDENDFGKACIGGGGLACLTLDESGPNTGVFEETVEVGVDIEVADVAAGDFSTEIELTYVDAVTSSGDVDEDRELTVRIVTGTGAFSRVPEKVGPGTEVTFSLLDLDLNENPNGKDTVKMVDDIIEINSSDGKKRNIGAEESGPNTGVFETTIQFEPRDVGDDGDLADLNCEDDCVYTVLPGDVFSIQYTDEQDALGNKVLITMVFEIISEDPVMEAAEPTTQVGETIELTVTDADANRDGEAQDSIDIDITSDQDPIGFTLAALETGDNTGVFTVSIPTSQSVSSGAIAVRTGSNVYLEYEDEFPSDYAVRKDLVVDPSKDFTLVVPVGAVAGNINATTPTKPVLSDLQGKTITSVTVGQQVILNVSIKNNNDGPQPFAGIVEIRDADGFTQYLQWQTGTINPGATVSVGLSFVPQESGTYTARTFVLSSVQQPTILSPVAESTFTVS